MSTCCAGLLRDCLTLLAPGIAQSVHIYVTAGVYDSLNDRFILSVFLKWGPANTVNAFLYVAITATNDPTGLWRTYLFNGYCSVAHVLAQHNPYSDSNLSGDTCERLFVTSLMYTDFSGEGNIRQTC